MLAISNKEFQECGCISCGCAFVHNSRGISGNGTYPVTCGECKTEFIILADGLEQSTIGIGTDKKVNGETVFEYPVLTTHPRLGKKSHALIVPDVRPEGIGEYCSSRGVGYDLACFVKSKEAGQRIVDMFEEVNSNMDTDKVFTCRLDYRPSEPLWIQVKIAYDKLGKNNAIALGHFIEQNESIITPDIIELATKLEFENSMGNFSSEDYDKMHEALNLLGKKELKKGKMKTKNR